MSVQVEVKSLRKGDFKDEKGLRVIPGHLRVSERVRLCRS